MRIDGELRAHQGEHEHAGDGLWADALELGEPGLHLEGGNQTHTGLSAKNQTRGAAGLGVAGSQRGAPPRWASHA